MDWQAHYEAADTPWDEGAPHPALLDYIAASGPFRGRILVPGCGSGHEVRAISTPENHVVGLDIAPAAIAKAQAFPKTGNEEYVVADLFNLAPQYRAAFDTVVEHTCFCAVEPSMRPAYAGAVAGALKPGGMLFAIFYLDPARDHQPPFGVAVEELDRLFSHDFVLIRQWVPVQTFEGRESRELVRLFHRIHYAGERSARAVSV
jgi:cyclopropane fatty-acyl-phospholipid synthase-like methyltransferase